MFGVRDTNLWISGSDNILKAVNLFWVKAILAVSEANIKFGGW